MTDVRNSHRSKFHDDPEFQSLLVRCLDALQRGERVDADSFAAEDPKYADEIRRFLDDRGMLEAIAAEFTGDDRTGKDSSPCEPTMDSRSTSRGWSAGETVRYIGEYEILEEIARGGMGIVFKARQQKLKRVVALKMILAGKLADDSDVERFHREARAAGRLKHPNIVPVHEIGEHEGRHYFTMDFVGGSSLADKIRDEALPSRRAAEIVQAAATAVHFAHEQGTVHRDLKPANVLLTADGWPHITDFGLAKMLESVDEESRAELTATGQVLGTPSYMSPEQASGKQELVGPASDVYSLGAILYACLTGRAPFVADSPVDTLLQVMRKEPISLRELNPSVPKDLETICLKCLTKEAHKRYGTAQELANDLGRFLQGRPVVARPVGLVTRYYRWCQRNPVVAALGVLLFASLALGTYFSSTYAVQAMRHAQNEASQRERAETARKEAEAERRDAEAARDEAEHQRDKAEEARLKEQAAHAGAEAARLRTIAAMSAEAKARERAEQSLAEAEEARREAEQRKTEAMWQTYVARLQPMMYRWEQRECGQLESMLDQAIPTEDDEPDFRGWEWRYLKTLGRQQTTSVGNGQAFHRFFDLHAATKRLAAFRGNELELWAGEPLSFQARIATHPPGFLRFSPGGTELAVADQFAVKILSVTSGDLIATIDLAQHPDTNRDSNRITSMEWRPDGSVLATGTDGGVIQLWNPKDGELVETISTLPEDFPCNVFHWHPRDDVLAIGTRYGQLFVIDIGQHRPLWVKRIDRDYVLSVRWNPGGTMLAGGTGSGSDNARLVIWNRDGEEVMRSSGSAFTGTPAIEWLNDDELVVATSDHDIHHFRHDSELPIMTIRVHDGPVQEIRNYGDGRRVVSSTIDEIRVTRVGDEVKLATAVQAHKFGIKALAWSPDSQRVATVSWDGIVSITNVLTGELIFELDGHANGAVNDVAWSPDGLRIASCDHSGEYRIWDADAGKLLIKFNGRRGSGGFNSLTWIDNDHVVGGHKSLWLYDVNSGETVRLIADSLRHFANLAYSPKRKRLSHLGSNRLAVYDLEGNEVHHREIAARKGLAWSPDGKLLLTGGELGIGVVDCINFKFLTTITGHAGTVTDACFSPDGSRIVSSGRDGTVRVWDRATGGELLILEHPDVRSFHCVGWSPDGSTIAAGAEGLVVAWRASPLADVRVPSSLATGKLASVKTRDEKIAELTQAVKHAPDDVGPLRQRADYYFSQMMWQEALADYGRIVEMKPSFTWEPLCAARAALMIGDREEFHRRLAVEVEKVYKTEPSNITVTGDFLASTAALVRHTDLDWSRLLPLSQAHSDAKGHLLWASRGVILLHLRLGNTTKVLNLLEKYQGAESANERILLSAVRSLVNHQLGDAEAAEEALAYAQQLAGRTWITLSEGETITYSNFGIFVEAKVLLGEAEEVVGSDSGAAAESSRPRLSSGD